MNKLILPLTVMLCASGSLATAGNCDRFTGCKAKACNIELQLRVAQQAGNESQERGLNKALQKVLRHCEDDGLRDDIEEDIRESEAELQEYQQELDEKTAKLRRKIDEKKSEIEALRAQLKPMQ